jgi:PAS domain S-box-containing protein
MTNSLSFEEYRILVEQSPIMIWRANTQAKCDYFNQQWLAFTGRSLEQELGDGWAEGVFADDMERCLQIYLNAFERREVFEMEYRLRRHDGVYRWIFDRGVPFLDASGCFGGYIGSCIDVTERVNAQHVLEQEREHEIRRLQGLLPICAACKKIRDDEGCWQAIEAYIRDHSEAEFSHGICPDCARRLFPDYSASSI